MTSVRKLVWNTLVLVMLVWNQFDINKTHDLSGKTWLEYTCPCNIGVQSI